MVGARWLGIVAVGVLVLAWVAPTSAQWQLEIEGGAMFDLQDIELSPAPDRVESDLDVGGSFALGAGYMLHDLVDLTGRFQGNFAGVDVGFSEDTFYALSLTGGARLVPIPEGRIRPWLAAELGWYWAEAEVDLLFADEAKRSDDSFGINAGGGVDFVVSDRVSLGIGVRYHNAFDAFGGLEFISTTFRVGILFGENRPY